jgi:hypothetical protein
MLLKRHFGLMAVGAVALTLLLGWVSTAEARQYKMCGNWVQRRGIAYIPFGAASGGMPAVNVAVNVTGSSPATFTVPTSAFGGSWSLTVPLPQPSLIQISTAFTNMHGPKSPGVMKKNHATTARVFPNFAYCPGAAANPNCTTHRSTGEGAPPGQGTNHGLVRYTKGTNGFGGTMQMVSGGGGVLSIVIGATGPTVLHNPFGGATGAAPTEAPGGPYGNISLVDVLPGGPITYAPGISPTYGLITSPGIQVGTGAPTTIINIGFSWTTGTVYVRGTNAGPVTSTTVTIMGTDNRHHTGAGNITLVAGGIGNRITSGRTFVDFDRVHMRMAVPTPSISPAGIAAGALLMVLASGYALRRRF